MVEPERLHVVIWISKTTRAQAHASARAPISTPIHAQMHTHALARTHTETCKTLIFYGNNGFVNAPHCYVIRNLPVLLTFRLLRFAINKLLHLSVCEYRQFNQNKTANGVLRDVIHTLYRGVLYFHSVTRFDGARANVPSFPVPIFNETHKW